MTLRNLPIDDRLMQYVFDHGHLEREEAMHWLIPINNLGPQQQRVLDEVCTNQERTHWIAGYAGTMVAQRVGLQRSTVRNIVVAWVLTLPASMVIAAKSTVT